MAQKMTDEDMKNLASWLQTILKEVQEARGAALAVRDNTALIPEIRNYVSRENSGQGQIDHKIDEAHNHLEAKISHLESQINDLKSMVSDVRNKVDRLK